MRRLTIFAVLLLAPIAARAQYQNPGPPPTGIPIYLYHDATQTPGEAGWSMSYGFGALTLGQDQMRVTMTGPDRCINMTSAAPGVPPFQYSGGATFSKLTITQVDGGGTWYERQAWTGTILEYPMPNSIYVQIYFVPDVGTPTTQYGPWQ
jgi:hypothetical protein